MHLSYYAHNNLSRPKDSVSQVFAEMPQRRWQSSTLCSLILFPLLPLLVLSLESDVTNKFFIECSQYSHCGDLKITYPFRLNNSPPYCGYPGYELNCKPPSLTINLEGKEYNVQPITDRNLVVFDSDFVDGKCPQSFTNTSINPTLFDFMDVDRNLTVYINCSFLNPPDWLTEITCLNDIFGQKSSYYKVDNGSSGFLKDFSAGYMCDLTAAVAVYETAVGLLGKGANGFGEALREGFGLTWRHDAGWCKECIDSDGICGYNETTPGDPTCFCSNNNALSSCSYQSKASSPRNNGLIIGLASGLMCFLLVCIVLMYYCIRKCNSLSNLFIWKKNEIALNIEAFLVTYESLGPKRYRYSDLNKITSKFSEKLGQGGYGAVFKGKLPDGRLVAVKVLSDAKGNGDEFVNEVASIGRTSHVNVVSLLGFSSEGSRRALIYDFMSNGSLEKYIYSENLKSTLGWEKLYQIAVGIAQGMEYLHRGCNARIVHFDIKPHNILLDHDFCPKIPDFGLAKLHLRKDSKFSAIDARGTIGYIAPEVFSRNFGVVSSKSDVYSYGMMVMEIVGGKNTSTHSGSDSSSERYFPHWIYEHFHEIGHLEGVNVTGETEEIVKKMILVGLWCIQAKPESRPSMGKVVDMLKNSIDDLEMPPKPYSSSP